MPASGSGKGSSHPYMIRSIACGPTEYSSSNVLHFEYIDSSSVKIYTDDVLTVEDTVVAVN